MDGKYPVIIDGETCGELTVSVSGLMTEFNAFCRDCGTVLRLSVYGDGGEGYLGVMMPEDGVLRLRKRLSRTSMAGFPSAIDHAGPAGLGVSGTSAETQLVMVDTSALTEELSMPVVMAVTVAEAIDMGLLTDSAGSALAAAMETAEDDPAVETVELAEDEPVVETAEIADDEPAIEIAEILDDEPAVETAEILDDEPAVETAEIADDEPAVETMRGMNNADSQVTIWTPAPNPWSMFSDTSSKMALRNVRGALSASIGGRTYLAIPSSGEERPEALRDFNFVETRNIEGILYDLVETDSDS